MPPRGVHRRRPAGHRGSSCDGAVTPGRTRQPRPPPPRRMNGGASVMARSVFPLLRARHRRPRRVVRCAARGPRRERRAASAKAGFCSVNRPSGHDPACSGPPRRRRRDASSAPGPFTVERQGSVGASLLPSGARRSRDRPALCRRSHAPGSSASSTTRRRRSLAPFTRLRHPSSSRREPRGWVGLALFLRDRARYRSRTLARSSPTSGRDAFHHLVREPELPSRPAPASPVSGIRGPRTPLLPSTTRTRERAPLASKARPG